MWSFYALTVVTLLLVDVGAVPSQMGLPYGTPKHIHKTRLSDSVDSSSNLLDRQNDNIKKYKACKAQYETESDGITQCFSLLQAGLTADEQIAVNGDTTFPDFLANEQAYLAQNPISITAAVTQDVKNIVSKTATAIENIASNLVGSVSSSEVQTEAGGVVASEADQTTRSKNQEPQPLTQGIGIGIPVTGPVAAPIPYGWGYVPAGPTVYGLNQPGPGQTWGYSTYSQYPAVQPAAFVSQYSSQAVPGFQYAFQGNAGGQSAVESFGAQGHEQSQLGFGAQFPAQNLGQVQAGSLQFGQTGQNSQLQGQSGFDSTQNTGAQYQTVYSAQDGSTQYSPQAQGFGYQISGSTTQFPVQGGAQNSQQFDFSSQNAAQGVSGAQYQGQASYGQYQNTPYQAQIGQNNAQFQGQGYDTKLSGSQFQGQSGFAAQTGGAQISVQPSSTSQYSVQGGALNSQTQQLDSTNYQSSTQGGFGSQYQGQAGYGQVQNTPYQGQTSTYSVAQYPAQVSYQSSSSGQQLGVASQYGSGGVTSATQYPYQYGAGSASQYGTSGSVSQYVSSPATVSSTQYGTSSSQFGGSIGSSTQYGGAGTSGSQYGVTGVSGTQYGGAGGFGTQYGVTGGSASQYGGAGGFGTQYGVTGGSASQYGGAAGSSAQYGVTGASGTQYGVTGGSGTQYGVTGGSGTQYGTIGDSSGQIGGSGQYVSQSSSSSTSQFGGADSGSAAQYGVQGYQTSGQTGPVVTQYTVQAVPVVTQYSVLGDPLSNYFVPPGFVYQNQGGPSYSSYSQTSGTVQQQ